MAAIYPIGWPWWIPLFAALLLVVAGGYLSEITDVLADDATPAWREGSRVCGCSV
jgi:hypothetical protein